jgi:hypothetical protein
MAWSCCVSQAGIINLWVYNRGHLQHLMPMKTATITQGFHKLFTGSRGHITNGVTVEALSHDPKAGLRKSWDINETVFQKDPAHTMDRLGLSQAEYDGHLADLQRLVATQSTPGSGSLMPTQNFPTGE